MKITRRLAAVAIMAITALTASTVVAGPASATSTSRLTQKVTTLYPYQGTTDVVSGTLTPSTRARTVYLQRKIGTTFYTQARTTTYRSAYRFTLPTRYTGKQTYRIYAPAGSGGTRAYGPAFTVTTRAKVASGGYTGPITGSTVVTKVVKNSCKRLDSQNVVVDFTVYFKDGRWLRVPGMKVTGMLYLGQLNYGGKILDLNWSFTC